MIKVLIQTEQAFELPEAKLQAVQPKLALHQNQQKHFSTYNIKEAYKI
jgi:hypothetical protein